MANETGCNKTGCGKMLNPNSNWIGESGWYESENFRGTKKMFAQVFFFINECAIIAHCNNQTLFLYFSSSKKTIMYTSWQLLLDNMLTLVRVTSNVQYTISFRYPRIEVHLKLLKSQSKFSGPRKFTSNYQLFKIKGVEMKIKIIILSKLYSLV